jgi:lipid-A-disaccharide synthase
MISAGEASGDRLGAGLARAILRRRPDAELFGMGGDDMASAGVRLVQHASEVAVVGLVEVLKHLPAIRRAMTRLEVVLRDERPDILVPVDYPDFNLRLAARARRAGVDVVYFVSPQVWAWRRGRVHRIRELVRRMLVLFPFEAAFYEDAGVPVTFVGHPAAGPPGPEPERAALLQRVGLDPRREVVALLPGSRVGEVTRMLPPMLEAATRLRAVRAGVQFLMPRASTLAEGTLESRVRIAGLSDVVVHAGDYPEVLRVCDAGAVCSGTASLEAALAGLPMVVVYRVRPVTYVLSRLLVRVEHAAMPNLVAGSRVVPELIQGECTGERIAGHLRHYLESPGHADEVRAALARVRDRLGKPGAFDRAANAVLDEIRP